MKDIVLKRAVAWLAIGAVMYAVAKLLVPSVLFPGVG